MVCSVGDGPLPVPSTTSQSEKQYSVSARVGATARLPRRFWWGVTKVDKGKQGQQRCVGMQVACARREAEMRMYLWPT